MPGELREGHGFLKQTTAIVSHIRVDALGENIDNLADSSSLNEGGQVNRGMPEQIGDSGDGVDKYMVVLNEEESLKNVDDDRFNLLRETLTVVGNVADSVDGVFQYLLIGLALRNATVNASNDVVLLEPVEGCVVVF
jgi:hypothetical protein